MKSSLFLKHFLFTILFFTSQARIRLRLPQGNSNSNKLEKMPGKAVCGVQDPDSIFSLQDVLVGTEDNLGKCLAHVKHDGANTIDYTMVEDNSKFPSIHKVSYPFKSKAEDIDDKSDLSKFGGVGAMCKGDSLLKNFKWKFNAKKTQVWIEYQCVKAEYDNGKCLKSATQKISTKAGGKPSVKILSKMEIPLQEGFAIKGFELKSEGDKVYLNYILCKPFSDAELEEYLKKNDINYLKIIKNVTQNKEVFNRQYYRFFYSFAGQFFLEGNAGKISGSEPTVGSDVEHLTNFSLKSEYNWTQSKTNGFPIDFKTAPLNKNTIALATGMKKVATTMDINKAKDSNGAFDMDILVPMHMLCKQDSGGVKRTRGLILGAKFTSKEPSSYSCANIKKELVCTYKEAFITKESEFKNNEIILRKRFEVKVESGNGIGDLQLLKKENGILYFGYDQCKVN